MTAYVLSLPFRIGLNGEAIKVDQTSNQYYGEQVTAILLTGKGERPLEPFFGMVDASFQGFNHSSLHTQHGIYLPELTNINAVVTSVTPDTQSVKVSFDIGGKL